MRTMSRLAAVVTVVGVGLATAEPPSASNPSGRVASAVALDWTGPATVRLGRPNPFTLTVTNTGPAAVQRVTVQVRPPADAKVARTAPAARVEDRVLVWDIGSLEPGEAKPLALTLTAGQRGDLTCPAWVTFTGAAGMTVKVQEPKLEVELKAPATVSVGERVELNAVVTNSGDTLLKQVDLRVVSPNPVPVNLGDGRTTTATDTQTTQCRDLRPGESRTMPFTARSDRPVDWRFSVTADAGDGVTATAEATIQVVAPKLTAAVAGPDKLLVGRTGTYTLTVKNAGELAVDSVAVVVPLPAGMKAASRLDYRLGTLAPGEERVVTFAAVAAATGPQPVAVAVTGSRGATAAAECRTVVDGVPALRVELLDTADPVEAGQETAYEVRVTNTGTKADADVRLVCELPEPLGFAGASGPTGHGLAPAGGRVTQTVVFDPIRELAPKTEAVFRVRVKATAAGDVRFKAVVTSTHLTAPVVKEESTRVYGD